MAELSVRAKRQIIELRSAYEQKDRPEAVRNLLAAVINAGRRIDRSPANWLPAPRPYPEMARPGERWIKEGRYWIAYRDDPPVILTVFYDQADLPGRA